MIFTKSLWGQGFPGGSESKESACNVGDLGWIPGLGRSPGEGNGYPPQYSCVETPWTVACQVPLSVGILPARILEWVAMPSSRGSSQPRDPTQVSHIAGGFFTIWATREAQLIGEEARNKYLSVEWRMNIKMTNNSFCDGRIKLWAFVHFSKNMNMQCYFELWGYLWLNI